MEKEYCKINYCMAWAVKRERKILQGEICEDLKKIINITCFKNKWEIKFIKVEENHVFIELNANPNKAPHNIVSEIKQSTASFLKKKYDIFKKMPSVWTKSYFISTLGDKHETYSDFTNYIKPLVNKKTRKIVQK